MHNIFPIACEASSNDINILFNDKITQSIIQRKAVAATDTSVKGFSMGGCWIIANVD